MDEPRVGLSLMLTDDFRAAAYPLFAAGEVDVLEWSFDMGWGEEGIATWACALLSAFADACRLIGHGVTGSLFSGEWTEGHEQWMQRLGAEMDERAYVHVSEHVGFMRAGAFVRCAPMPVPYTPELVELGRERLRHFADIAGCPVGMENLALAFCRDDVFRQGEMLDRWLDDVGGFVLLDLHNLFCQSINFDVEPDRLLDAYPLERVREVHLAGGSWSVPSVRGTRGRIRRDTHDDAIPAEVFGLLQLALERCPRLAFVIIERLGGTLGTLDAAERFAADYRRAMALVRGAAHA